MKDSEGTSTVIRGGPARTTRYKVLRMIPTDLPPQTEDTVDSDPSAPHSTPLLLPPPAASVSTPIRSSLRLHAFALDPLRGPQCTLSERDIESLAGKE